MIKYLIGDATKPCDNDLERPKIIAHICNDVGAWGRGFVLSLSKEWPAAEANYRNWYQQNMTNSPSYLEPTAFQLGNMKLIHVSELVYVANMIAQRGIKSYMNVSPIRYEALEDCLDKLALEAKNLNASIHMPRIGCGLAGGTWSQIEVIIKRALNDIDVYVYDFIINDAHTKVKL
jgi:O-acetyl-ADP-ribose deacetylase (regulator of RNase III)